MRLPEVYGECKCCGCVIYSGDTFASILEEGEVVGFECEACMEKESEKNGQTRDRDHGSQNESYSSRGSGFRGNRKK